MGLDIYAEEMISHYEHPHNKGMIVDPTISYRDFNPTCGDDITIYLSIENEIVKEVKFVGEGCAISIGSASMLTDYLKGKSVNEIKKFGVKDLIELIGIDPGPVRLKCATLSLHATHKALEQIVKA